jgi:hypothetical protein
MTTDQPDHSGDMRATYVRVIVVEVIVLLALWVFSSILSG